jgi:hypothetical protein
MGVLDGECCSKKYQFTPCSKDAFLKGVHSRPSISIGKISTGIYVSVLFCWSGLVT